jgi:hypothetical protein
VVDRDRIGLDLVKQRNPDRCPVASGTGAVDQGGTVVEVPAGLEAKGIKNAREI